MADTKEKAPRRFRPTVRALQRHPRAVILASWIRNPDETGAARFDAVASDFEWFDTRRGADDYYDDLAKWAENEQPIDGEHIAILQIEDTGSDPMDFERWVFFGETDDATLENDLMEAGGPGFFVIPDSKPGAAGSTSRKVKPKVKGRAPSPAAAMLKDGIETKPKRAVKPKAQVKARAKNVDLDALKARLAGELKGMGASDEAVAEALTPDTDSGGETVMSLVHKPVFQRLRRKVLNA